MVFTQSSGIIPVCQIQTHVVFARSVTSSTLPWREHVRPERPFRLLLGQVWMQDVMMFCPVMHSRSLSSFQQHLTLPVKPHSQVEVCRDNKPA